jgi:hypothetical protein
MATTVQRHDVPAAERAQDVTTPAREVSREEGRQILDRAARRRLGVSGQEFLQRWDAGEYVGKADEPDIARVAILIPFGR